MNSLLPFKLHQTRKFGKSKGVEKETNGKEKRGSKYEKDRDKAIKNKEKAKGRERL